MQLWRKHWKPQYVWDRVGLAAWEKLHPDAPWLVAGAIHFLEEWLRTTDVIVEFGSGRSTVWFAQRVGHLISIEHDRKWHGQVKQRLASRGLSNVRYHLVDDKPQPNRYVGEDQLERPEMYVAPAQTELDAIGAGARADAALVDGCSRDRCAVWAVSHVKPGGILVVDNANWYLPVKTRTPGSVGPHGAPPSDVWKQFVHATASWRRVWFSSGVTDTVIFFVPMPA